MTNQNTCVEGGGALTNQNKHLYVYVERDVEVIWGTEGGNSVDQSQQVCVYREREREMSRGRKGEILSTNPIERKGSVNGISTPWPHIIPRFYNIISAAFGEKVKVDVLKRFALGETRPFLSFEPWRQCVYYGRFPASTIK